MYSRISGHLDKYKLFGKIGVPYVEGSSVMSMFWHFFDKVIKHENKDDLVDIVYLYFQKTFDNGLLSSLLKKMSSHSSLQSLETFHE